MNDARAAAFEPVILAFTCNWCSYRAADLAGTARIKYPPNVRLVRLMCSGRLDPVITMPMSCISMPARSDSPSGNHRNRAPALTESRESARGLRKS